MFIYIYITIYWLRSLFLMICVYFLNSLAKMHIGFQPIGANSLRCFKVPPMAEEAPSK